MNLKRFATRALYATLVTGGLTLLGAGVAHASETSGDDGILSGTQAIVSIAVPVTVSGNGISVLGDSSSTGAATEVAPAAPPAESAPESAPATSGDDSLLGGLQGLVDVAIPVTVGGNAISVIGDSQSTDAATEVAPAAAPPKEQDREER
ncbi:chaplin family protein, partial [Agromyces sp. Leaf222]|uniref:chaplin family protein n=1 Tax=Agromyces sp. Leaf222 TaxID=1735688 RepID=UPI001F43BBAD